MSPTLPRVRIVLIGLVMGVIALSAGGIFDRWVLDLVVAVIVPTVVALLVQPFHPLVRAAGFTAAVVTGVAAVVFIAGGEFGDVVDSFVRGAPRLLTTDWPSPDRAELIGTVALLLAVTTALACELAGRARWHLLPLAPVLTAKVAVIALSAPLGVRLVWLIPLALLFAAFSALRPGAELADRGPLLLGERRLVPIVLVAVIISGAISVPVAMATRADPRRNEPAERTAALFDPIEATLALRSLESPIDLHHIAASTDQPLPARWRTAALDTYDGQRWLPALTLRPIGRRLGPDTDPSFEFELRFLDDDVTLLPIPGEPITADARLETDEDRTVVRLAERRDAADAIDVTSALAPDGNDALDRGIATRPVDESVTGLTEFASTLAGDGTVLEQLRQIEATMRNDFALATNAPGGGLQRALIDRFIRDTQRGTAEQFATAFVLLARSLGVDARIATGFATPVPSTDGTLTLTSADALVWPEVHLLDDGWIAFDPVPTTEDADVTPPPEEPAVQTPAAAQPPIAPAPEPSSDAQPDVTDDDATTRTTLSTIGFWAGRVALGSSILLLPVVLAMAIILGLKHRRRRRRLAADAAADRVNGAWALATDRLVDAGLPITSSATNGDIATTGARLTGTAHRELRRLANLSSAVTFGHPPQQGLLAEHASDHLESIESAMASELTTLERWRWRLSLRSLRRSTRSPVRH